MQMYNDLIELAQICLKQARAATSSEVAAELRRMAREYRERAAKLNGGSMREIGKDYGASAGGS